jgi:5'-nucleotidase / UDP-sugar diphosphatase
MSRITRRHTLGLGIGAGLSVTMLSGSGEPADAAPNNASFSLLLVNDIYKLSETRGRGGFAKLAAVVKSERARGVPMLFCHAGDTFSPSLLSGFDQGAHIVELTNLIRPDVFVPGNHEFDFGLEVFRKRMSEANFPFFAANLRQQDGSVFPGIKDTALFSLGPVTVGVVGLALATTPTMSQSGTLTFAPELATLPSQVGLLRQQGADFVVAVAHTDRATDFAIVRSRLVDVLLTGHDHDLAIGYDGKTVMVESSEEGNFVTAIDFVVDIKGSGKDRKVSWSPSFRVHDSSTIDPDPEVLAIVHRFEAGLSDKLDIEVGVTTFGLDSRIASVRSQETAIGDLVADAIRGETGADVAITNGGGIRANKQYPAGARLSRRDILSELPFGNTTILVAIPGARIHDALENGVSMLDERAGRFPQVSGLQFEVDSKAPAGSRIVFVKVNGEPLDLQRIYKVASNNFMLAGGDGYDALAQGKTLIGATDGTFLANAVIQYLEKTGRIAIKPEGRIVIR